MAWHERVVVEHRQIGVCAWDGVAGPLSSSSPLPLPIAHRTSSPAAYRACVHTYRLRASADCWNVRAQVAPNGNQLSLIGRKSCSTADMSGSPPSSTDNRTNGLGSSLSLPASLFPPTAAAEWHLQVSAQTYCRYIQYVRVSSAYCTYICSPGHTYPRWHIGHR